MFLSAVLSGRPRAFRARRPRRTDLVLAVMALPLLWAGQSPGLEQAPPLETVSFGYEGGFPAGSAWAVLEAARIEAARIEAENLEAAHVEAARAEAARAEAARAEAVRVEAENLEAARVEEERAAVLNEEASAPAPSGSPGLVASGDVSVWDDLAACESGGNWAINTGNGYSGGLQFHPTTWRGFGGEEFAPFAHQASRTQQIAVAERILAVQGFGAWPGCKAKLGLR